MILGISFIWQIKHIKNVQKSLESLRGKEMKNVLNKIGWKWIKFWGRKFFVYENNKYKQTILFFGHRIYILDEY